MTPTAADLARENEALRQQLREAEELLGAVRTGAVDALAVPGAEGPRLFILESADYGYRHLVEQMSEGAVLLGAAGVVLYCNEALATALGCAPAQVLGHAFTDFIPAGYRLYWDRLWQQGWQGQTRGELPLQNCQTGLLRPFSVSMNVLTLGGAPTLAVLLADMSAREEITNIRSVVAHQNALLDRKSEELVRQQVAQRAVERTAAEASRLLEGIPQMAWTADLAGRITYFNQRWREFTGQFITSEAQLKSLFHHDDFGPALARWHHALDTFEPLEVECRLRNVAGDYRWMLGRALPSYNEHGALIQWIGTFTDIHEHKLDLERIDQTQRLLQANNEQLSRVNVDLDNFVYAASHDLKQPVNNIEGLLQALLDDLPNDLPEPVDEILGMMGNAVERFKRTVEQLTDITRVQREASTPTLVSLADVVYAVELDLAVLIKEANAQLSISVQGCPSVPFMEKNLRSVVYNLLSNALKYRDSARPLRVQLSARPTNDHYVRLAVQDNGLGLDAAGQQKLFGMFQRLHSHVEGTGIGLYMVKKMVENAGGRIEVISELHVGSTFVVYLPQQLSQPD